HRAEVNELDGDGSGHGLVQDGVPRPARSVRRAEREHGPDQLATRRDQVRRDLGEERVGGRDGLEEASVDPVEISFEVIETGRPGRRHAGVRVRLMCPRYAAMGRISKSEVSY